MGVERSAIEALIPHRGHMCLLDEVLACDEHTIVCRAASHRSSAHPLREDDVLPAICGIEYGAQAVAVHGAMNGGGRRRSGLLAAARDVSLSVDRLDDIEGDLIVSAHRLIVDGGRALYEFDLHAGGKALVHGRVAIVLEAAGER